MLLAGCRLHQRGLRRTGEDERRVAGVRQQSADERQPFVAGPLGRWRAVPIGDDAGGGTHHAGEIGGALEPRVGARHGPRLLDVERLAGRHVRGVVHQQYARHPVPRGQGLRDRGAHLARADDGHRCH